MWNILASWVTVGVVIPILITIGIGVLSMTPPEFTTAHICFSLSAVILMARLGWWLAFEHPASQFQSIVFAFIIFGIIGCLWLISMRWVSEREHKFTKSTAEISNPPEKKDEHIALSQPPKQPAIHPPHTQQPEQEAVPDVNMSLIQEPIRYAPGLNIKGIT